MRDIAKNIRTLRISRNMTQDELAEKLFVTRQTVSNYETGKSRPDVDMLARIAEVLETDVTVLIYGAPTPVSRRTDYLVAALCGAFVLLNLGTYAYLQDRADFIARMYYGVKPTILLITVYRPLFFLFLGWTMMQLLKCVSSLKPYSGRNSGYIRAALWMAVVLFFLAEAPLILACFVDISTPAWWNRLAWLLHGNASRLSLFSVSNLPILLGAGLWLCGFPKKFHR